jgi:hypothetical protein
MGSGGGLSWCETAYNFLVPQRFTWRKEKGEKKGSHCCSLQEQAQFEGIREIDLLLTTKGGSIEGCFLNGIYYYYLCATGTVSLGWLMGFEVWFQERRKSRCLFDEESCKLMFSVRALCCQLSS